MSTLPRVEQFINSRGNPTANHFIIHQEDVDYFQSYKSIVVRFSGFTGVTLGKHWDYSNTTAKYVGQYLNSNSKEIRAKIKSGEYKYDEDMV